MTLTYGVGTGASLCLAIWVVMLLHNILSLAILPASARVPKFLVLQYVFMLSVHLLGGLPFGRVPRVYAPRSIFGYLWFAILCMWPKNFICFRIMSSMIVCLSPSVWRILSFLIFIQSCHSHDFSGTHYLKDQKTGFIIFFQSPGFGPI